MKVIVTHGMGISVLIYVTAYSMYVLSWVLMIIQFSFTLYICLMSNTILHERVANSIMVLVSQHVVALVQNFSIF